jgi:uncharacterized protein YuzB (UPF0349 family)
MNLEALSQIVKRLRLNAPDMMDDSQFHVAALNRSVGKLSQAIAQLEAGSTDDVVRNSAMQHCGASILVLFSLIENLGLNLEAAIAAGEQELR